jgi:L-alanine-DL-glutamate epimerase-like enolase superfamily enzyme
VGAEAALDGYDSPVPLCADELVEGQADLPKAAGRFGLVNIKLDKCGGLTTALRLADAATEAGFGLMVGCMGGSSLNMAPAMVLAQRCAFVDLDAPLFLTEDCANGLMYANGLVEEPYLPALWG